MDRQMYALIFGIAYLGVALLEVAHGSGGLKFGGVIVLQIQLVQNLIHWSVGLAVSWLVFRGNPPPSWWRAPSALCSSWQHCEDCRWNR